MKAFARTLLCTLSLFATGALAETLVLPDALVDLRSPQGEAFLLESQPLDAYAAIASSFETQKNQSFCGVASMVMALNALRVPAPTSPEYAPYSFFTQENILDDKTEAILPKAVLLRQGMTLDQLGQMLALHAVGTEVHHAADGDVDAFRKAARAYLAKDRVVLVNYLRRSLGQERGGHISPLAAYDEKADRFLVLDVARYKYPPVWVSTADLFAAMNTPDRDNDNKMRGYVLVTAKAPAVR